MVVGFIFQEFNLIPVLTAYENVEYPLLLVQHVPAAERRQRVLTLLEAVGVSDQRDKYPDQLSGGQKQRIAAATSRSALTPIELRAGVSSDNRRGFRGFLHVRAETFPAREWLTEFNQRHHGHRITTSGGRPGPQAT
jgi:ABC-type iron transport system FetAB ATPase subunit